MLKFFLNVIQLCSHPPSLLCHWKMHIIFLYIAGSAIQYIHIYALLFQSITSRKEKNTDFIITQLPLLVVIIFFMWIHWGHLLSAWRTSFSSCMVGLLDRFFPLGHLEKFSFLFLFGVNLFLKDTQFFFELFEYVIPLLSGLHCLHWGVSC